MATPRRKVASVARGFGVALLVLGLAGCASYARRAADVKQRLIGLDAHVLQQCLGTPRDSATVGEDEYLRFWWRTPHPGPPLLDPYGAPVGGGKPPPDERDDDPSWVRTRYCRLTFVLRDGRIADVEAIGRNEHGLKADHACLIEAERCLPGFRSR